MGKRTRRTKAAILPPQPPALPADPPHPEGDLVELPTPAEWHGIPIESLADANKVAHLRRTIEALTKDNRSLRERLGARQELAETIAGAVEAASPYPPFRYQTTVRKPEAVACLKLSDWHIGEVVNPAETEGFGGFNWAIAQERIHTIAQDFLKWVNLTRHGTRIEELVVFAEGDFISGDIHEELKVTNEFPTPVQVANAGLLAGEIVRALSSHFRRTRVSWVAADNHSRQTRKPQAKLKTLNSLGYAVQVICYERLRACHRVQWQAAEGMSQVVTVGPYQFLTEHGDTIRGWAGNPYYGFHRRHAREAERRMNTDKGFHYWSFAHFHVPAVINGHWLVNGSLSGTSEFDHSQGRHALPCQVGFLVGPKGVYGWVPFGGGATQRAASTAWSKPLALNLGV